MQITPRLCVCVGGGTRHRGIRLGRRKATSSDDLTQDGHDLCKQKPHIILSTPPFPLSSHGAEHTQGCRTRPSLTRAKPQELLREKTSKARQASKARLRPAGHSSHTAHDCTGGRRQPRSKRERKE
ncbi:hypothetical protein PoB_006655100 [Plakobranchus ocellatus]|uniref:Uncharacterized protein n=1 Tax=Plakobranchus ocellatus TaxID=259542 RepID=A0AAV4D7B7_9GAST|nr:hypothetical protein PoB_006655100 [Plakobranchus ocellatus]